MLASTYPYLYGTKIEYLLEICSRPVLSRGPYSARQSEAEFSNGPGRQN